MSRRIIQNLFRFARQENAQHLIISSRPEKISVTGHFSDGRERNFLLPKKLEATFLDDLRTILAVAPGELISQKYYKYRDQHQELNLQLTIRPEAGAETIIIKLLDRTNKDLRLNQLGWQPVERRQAEKLLQQRSGLIIVSSPPGQGKSTTLYSFLSALDHSGRNVYLLAEDSAQEIPGVNRLKPTTLNWEKMRQHDADIIFADDRSDDQTLEQALLTAATGRLVYVTLTAANSWTALDKVMKINLPGRLKLDGLKAIISQRLDSLKTPSKSGAAPHHRPAERRAIGLFEIFELTPALKNFILTAVAGDKKFPDQLAAFARKTGFRPLALDQLQKIKDGVI